jgi:thiamine biosynthesis protein ThiI
VVRRPPGRHIHGALAGLHVKEVRTPIGRIEIVLGQDEALPEVLDRLKRVFGIANYSVATRVPRTSKAWRRRSCRAAAERIGADFRVFVRRADQKFPMPRRSSRAISDRGVDARGWKVDLDHADLVIRVEILPGCAFCTSAASGPGGLPTGTGGRLVALLSGGIDSPVAAWRMMRRGCQVDACAFSQRAVPVETCRSRRRGSWPRC